MSANWWLQSAVTHDGSDAGRSGFLTDNQASAFQTTGSFGAGSVSFWWKVSSEPGADVLRFFIDGVVKDTISGEVGWQQKSYPVTAGSHTLKWEYAKNSSGAGGIDAAWVDQVVLPAALVLWTRGDTGEATLWTGNAGTTPGAFAVAGSATITEPSGQGGPWEAVSCAHSTDASGDYVLWTRGDTGQAILAKVNQGEMPDSGQVRDLTFLAGSSWAYLSTPDLDGNPWRAASYSQQDASCGYVLWARSDTGQAVMWKVVPGDVSGTIPVTSWEYVSSPNGEGSPWRAASYVHGATPGTPAAEGEGNHFVDDHVKSRDMQNHRH